MKRILIVLVLLALLVLRYLVHEKFSYQESSTIVPDRGRISDKRKIDAKIIEEVQNKIYKQAEEASK